MPEPQTSTFIEAIATLTKFALTAQYLLIVKYYIAFVCRRKIVE